MSKTILVVDDEASVRKAVRDALSKVGYVVTEALSGRAALGRPELQSADLVLLDARMPDLSGWDVLRLIRDSQTTRHTPVVMLTAMSDPECKALGWSLGCAFYLTKPIVLKDLLLVVEHLLAEAPEPAGVASA